MPTADGVTADDVADDEVDMAESLRRLRTDIACAATELAKRTGSWHDPYGPSHVDGLLRLALTRGGDQVTLGRRR